MSDVGIIILGVVLAVVGYLIERFFTGVIATLGKITLIVGVLIFVIGFILLAYHLVSANLMILPQIMLA